MAEVFTSVVVCIMYHLFNGKLQTIVNFIVRKEYLKYQSILKDSLDKIIEKKSGQEIFVMISYIICALMIILCQQQTAQNC